MISLSMLQLSSYCRWLDHVLHAQQLDIVQLTELDSKNECLSSHAQQVMKFIQHTML